MPASLFLRPQHDPSRRAGGHLAVGLLRLAEPAGLSDRRGMVVARDKPWRQRIQRLGGGREVALERVHAEEPAFVVIEIDEVETDFALAGRGDFDQPAAQGEATEGAAEHDAADEIEDYVRAPSAGRRTNLGRQVVGADDQL